MSWLDKLFGTQDDSDNAPKTASTAPFAGLDPGIRFGHYSDNNKSYTRTQSWYIAEDRFKEKRYTEAFAAFFDYIRDDDEESVVFRPDGRRFTFELLQGSKKVYGECDGDRIVARAALAHMELPGNAVMRRLLELNFHLYYTRTALDDKNNLCMIFDTSVPMASPNKLYNGLRELAKTADRQDDLLVIDFAALKPTDTDHIQPLSEQELDVKYTYFRKWIQDALNRVSGLNADSFSGAIAYCFLTLIYRIDFLLVPQAKLMTDIEQVSNLYWNKKDETPLVERNAMMQEAVRKLLDITREEFAKGVYRTRSTFAMANVPTHDKLREHVDAANKDALWYVDNKYPDLAFVLNEFGMTYSQFAFSVPRVITDLTVIYMAVIHADFFRDLGMASFFYHPDTRILDQQLITKAIDAAIAKWPDKYTDAYKWDHSKVSYASLWDFARTFTEQAVHLDLEMRR